MKSWNEDLDFKQLLLEDEQVMSYLSFDDIENVFRLENFLGQIDFIFDRVFGGKNEDA